MRPFLMGSETEYAVSGRNGRGPVSAEHVYERLNEAVRQERRWLPDVAGGRAIYLEHGGRFYLDCGGHPEYATPECFTPAQVACYDKAGEHILELARARLRHAHPDIKITIAKNNIPAIASQRVTWGSHESYTCWVPLMCAAPQLVPHLVSRTIYSGAGCLSDNPQGPGFELSQRAAHLVQVTGAATMSDRAIFCTRIRKAADSSPKDGWIRVHLIARDSQRASFGTYLTFGATGLLFVLINESRMVGQGLALADPVQALHAISLDPWLRVRVPLADGRRLTALEIQESYLAECARAVQAGGLPEWAPEVIRHWDETLTALARDPLRMAGKLDPYCKLLIYDHELRRAGYGWSDLQQALKVLGGLHERHRNEVIRAVLAADPRSLPAGTQSQYAEAVAAADSRRPGVLDRLRFAVRLQALDLHYHELGGLHDELAASGHVKEAVSPADIEQASREPPAGGRAAVRGACVKSSREGGWVCDWRYLYHAPTGALVDLRNPFATEGQPRHRDSLEEEDRLDAELLQIFSQRDEARVARPFGGFTHT